jgi:hypothetical protein
MYASGQGRWLTPDPADMSWLRTLNPQSWNRYSYTSGNPTGMVDPSGLWNILGYNMGGGWFGGIFYAGYGLYNSLWNAGPFGGGGCSADNLDMPCGLTGSIIESGAGLQCPYNVCTTGLTPGNLTAIAQFNPNTGTYQQVTPWTYLGMTLQQFQAAYFDQLNATAAALAAAGQSQSTIDEFMALNGSPNWATIPIEGGNFDFQGASLFTGLANICPWKRCDEGSLGTLDFSHDDGTFHLDTADPYNFPGGTLVHIGIDVLGGNFGWGVIPR